jgi:spore germination protein
MTAQQTLASGPHDNQIVDGFRKIDGGMEALTKGSETTTSPLADRKPAFQGEPTIQASAAQQKLVSFTGINDAAWNVRLTRAGAKVPVYLITSGKQDRDHITGAVSQRGGHVVSFYVDRTMKPGNFDFAEAQSMAKNWLADKGFGPCEPIHSNQYDGVADFIFVPQINGVPVLNRGITIKVALDNGHIVGFDATKYFEHAIHNVVATRKYDPAMLRKRLNPRLHVEMMRRVIIENWNDEYRPAVAFYVVSHGDTYCIYMDANNGRELSIEPISET